ncbi:MAG: ThuA domain-containing protein [Planctomycetaceae bacterium]|nr:ThuA domain-containing protein [Planctomycetaceae bacterium]
MNRRVFLSVVAVLAAALPALAADEAAQKPDAKKADGKKPRILYVTESKGFVHGAVRRQGQQLAPSEIAMKQLAQQTGEFTIDMTQDTASDFTKENLQNYDVVMFYTTLDLPIAKEDRDYFFNEWLKQPGHGFIGIHSATDTFHDYEPYWDMVGGTFISHPWSWQSKVNITIHDPDHPTMKPFGGKEVEWIDEIYQYTHLPNGELDPNNHWQPEKVHVLMSLDMAKTELKKPYHVPVAWVKNYGEGRVYYNNLGHNNETWTKKPFLDSILAGIKWVTGEVEGDATPNPEVSAKEEEKAKAAAGG